MSWSRNDDDEYDGLYEMTHGTDGKKQRDEQLKEDKNVWPTKEDDAAIAPNFTNTYKGKWIIGSIHKETGAISFSINPMKHPSREAARKESVRLARLDTSKVFIVANITDMATAQDVVFL